MKCQFACMMVLCVISPLFAQQKDVTRIGPDLEVQKLHGNVWIHVSYANLPGYGRVGANGLIIRGEREVMLVDTPWNNDLTRQLYDWIKTNWGMAITRVAVCHYHEDNLGGLGFLHEKGVLSYGLAKTADICRQRNLPIPVNTFSSSMVLSLAPVRVELWFPGAGHTVDSICAWIPEAKILFGGCSVKALSNASLGNVAEADLASWPQSIRNMRARYPGALVVVPGHGEPGGLELLDHTLKLLENRR